ncbi:type VI secretion system-associated FHA domain protein TagH [Massilia sp. W12]|uniref:type VI secretion system-associated FHA domain protein TagH n=1 Tax=Massilia sp. W12 TaxID=3126507 RepID=UPI0030D0E38C
MIKIAVVSYNNEAPASPISAIFGPERATIGRSEGNFLVLPDPKHYVSRSQAAVWSNGMRHHIVNLSQANPILINGKELEPEREYDIHAGDEIQIGLYRLRAEAYTGQPVQNPTQPVAHSQTQAMAGTQTIPPAMRQPAPTATAPAAAAAAPLAAAAAPAPAAEAQSPEQISAAAAAAAEAAHLNELLHAFLNGAGVPNLALSTPLNAELMEMLGKLVAASINGAMQLIAQRALVKREVNAEVTMVVLRKNNPLKFFPDSQTVLTQMLRKKMPGFMEPHEAMEDSFHDLYSHQLGVIAGMKAAMEGMLKRLHPTVFEKKLKQPSLMDSLNPARRKAEMWDCYMEQFNGISHEAKGDIQNLIGKEFLAAYEKEVERVRHPHDPA